MKIINYYVYFIMNNYIIGIAGNKNAGKDTIANMINYIFKRGVTKASYADWALQKAKLYNMQDRIIHFADANKDILSILFPIDRIYFDSRKYKDELYYNLTTGSFVDSIIAEYDKRYRVITIDMLKEHSLNYIIKHNDSNYNTKYDAIKLRTLLQYFGTEICRNQLGDDIWINTTMNKATRIAVSRRVCIIADVRFTNEADRIRCVNDLPLYGRVVKIVRNADKTDSNSKHESEQGINNYDYLIENNGSLMQLFYKVLDIIQQII